MNTEKLNLCVRNVGNRTRSVESFKNVSIAGRKRVEENCYFILQSKQLVRRIVTNEEVFFYELPGLFKECNTFEELKNLYYGQKDKSYFDFISACTCFSQVIIIYIESIAYEKITVEELIVFRDTVLLYRKSFNDQAFANFANPLVKLLDYAQLNEFRDLEEFASYTLCMVFRELTQRGDLQKFDSQALSNLANAAMKLLEYAKRIKFKEAEVLAYITICCIFQAVNKKKNLQTFDPQHLANLANDAIKLLEHAQKNGPKKAKVLVYHTLCLIFLEVKERESLQRFDFLHLINLAHAGVKFLDYMQRSENEEDQAFVFGIVCCIFAEIDRREKKDKFDDLDFLNLSNLANAVGKFLDYLKKNNNGEAKPFAHNILCGVFKTVYQRAVDTKGMLEDFNPQSLSNLAKVVIKVLSNTEKIQFENFKVLAYDTLICIFQAVILRGSLQDFHAQNLVNLADCGVKIFANAQKSKGAFEELVYKMVCSIFQEVGERAKKEQLQDFDPQDLSNLANVMTKILELEILIEEEELFCDTVYCAFQAIKSRENLDDFNAQDFSELANSALKILNYVKKKRYQEVEGLVSQVISYVFQAVNKRENLKDFHFQSLVNLANALVKAGYWDDVTQLLVTIGQELCKRDIDVLDLQSICNLAWAFAIGKRFSLIDHWIINGLSRLEGDQFNELVLEDAQQLYMAFLRQALDCKIWNPENPDAFLNVYLKKELVEKILKKVNQKVANKTLRTSKLQKSVSEILRKNLPSGYYFKEEYYIKPYSVDFAIFLDIDNGKQKLIGLVEVNGPSHFMDNGDYTLCHQFKEQLLNDMFYSNIVNINYFEYNKSKDKKSLINQKISKIINPVNSNERFWIDNFMPVIERVDSELMANNFIKQVDNQLFVPVNLVRSEAVIDKNVHFKSLQNTVEPKKPIINNDSYTNSNAVVESKSNVDKISIFKKDIKENFEVKQEAVVISKSLFIRPVERPEAKIPIEVPIIIESPVSSKVLQNASGQKSQQSYSFGEISVLNRVSSEIKKVKKQQVIVTGDEIVRRFFSEEIWQAFIDKIKIATNVKSESLKSIVARKPVEGRFVDQQKIASNKKKSTQSISAGAIHEGKRERIVTQPNEVGSKDLLQRANSTSIMQITTNYKKSQSLPSVHQVLTAVEDETVVDKSSLKLESLVRNKNKVKNINQREVATGDQKKSEKKVSQRLKRLNSSKSDSEIATEILVNGEDFNIQGVQNPQKINRKSLPQIIVTDSKMQKSLSLPNIPQKESQTIPVAVGKPLSKRQAAVLNNQTKSVLVAQVSDLVSMQKSQQASYHVVKENREPEPMRKSKPGNYLEIMKSISSYMLSIPALMLYLLLIMLSMNLRGGSDLDTV